MLLERFNYLMAAKTRNHNGDKTLRQRPGRLALAWAVAAASLLCAGSPALGGEPNAPGWPQWLGPHRSGVSGETNWTHEWGANGPPVLWRAAAGTGYGAIAVAGGRLYTLGNTDDKDSLTCLDAASGKELWKHPYACPAIIPKGLIQIYPGPRSTPTVDAGRVYSLSRAGHLLCLDAAKGELIWKRDLRDQPLSISPPTWGMACSPLIVGKHVVVDAGRIVAFDAATGELAWQSRKYRQAYASPVAISVGGRQCVAAYNGDGLAVVDAADGKEILLHPFKFLFIDNCTTPLVRDGNVFISTCQNPGSSVVRIGDDGKATTVWRNGEMQNLFSNSVLAGEHLYGFHGGLMGPGALRCVEFATGDEKWTAKTLKMGGLVAAGPRLLILTDDGDLAVVSASSEKFRLLAKATILKGPCWAHPVLVAGRVYLRNAAGDVVCVDVRGKKQ